jgi:hypothetical protein
MGSTPICTIDETGIHKPEFIDCMNYFVNAYRAIYGSDVYLGADSQDGQWIGIQTQALDDANAMCVAAYNAFSPSTAQGADLSRVVKINGISRLIPSNSTCDVLIVGVVGTIISGGVISDLNRNNWNLPNIVVIPSAGQILVTATAQETGSIQADTEELTTIETPVVGWQTVSNPTPAFAGDSIETDLQLRNRQTKSTMIASQGILDGMVGSLMEIPGIINLRGYENDLNIPDTNGIPGHCIAIVIDGGDVNLIAGVIAAKKSFAGTYGTTSIQVGTPFGLFRKINFFRSTNVDIHWVITVKALMNFTLDIQTQIQQALVDWTNARGIGNSLQYPRAYEPAQLLGKAASSSFELVSLSVGRGTATPGVIDIPIAFNEKAFSILSHVAITVVT